MPFDQSLPKFTTFQRASDRAFEPVAQLIEDVDGRLPVLGLVKGFGWRQLSEQEEFWSKLSDAPLDKV